MLKISMSWFPGAGLWIVVSTCSNSSSFISVILHRAVFISFLFYQVLKRQCMNMMKNLRSMTMLLRSCLYIIKTHCMSYLCVFERSFLGVKICFPPPPPPPEGKWYGVILSVLRVLGHFSLELSLVVTPY